MDTLLRDPVSPLGELPKFDPELLDVMPLAASVWARNGRLLYYNRRAVELWGCAPDPGDPVHRMGGFLRILHADGRDMAEAETPLAQVLRSGKPVDGAEVMIERADGSRIVVLAHVAPIKGGVGEVLGATSCIRDITARKRMQDEVEARERHFRALLDALPAAIYTTDAAGRVTFYNEAAAELAGREPVIGVDEWCVTWRLYRPDGSFLPHDECPMAVALKEKRTVIGGEAIAERPDGTRVPFLAHPTPLFDDKGELVGAVNMLIDMTEPKRAIERQKRLIDELNHRVKNTLATVQSLAGLTIRGAGVPQMMREAFQERLFALSHAHDQLTREHWESADLAAIVPDILAPYRGFGDRIRLAGEPVKLAPRAALVLAMTLHELTANAAKYGALSAPQGTLAVSWAAVADGGTRRVRLDWEESGGPTPQHPAQRGFGLKFIERGIAAELRGAVDLRFEPGGMRCSLDFPLAGAASPAVEGP